MLSALKKVGYALRVTLLVALHGIASAAIIWFVVTELKFMVSMALSICGPKSSNGPNGWTLIEISNLWTFIPAVIAGVAGALFCMRRFYFGDRDFGCIGEQVKVLCGIIYASCFGWFLAITLGGVVGAAACVVLAFLGNLLEEATAKQIASIVAVAGGAIGFLIGIGKGVDKAGGWDDIFSSSGGGYSSGSGGGSYSSPSPSPSSYSLPPVEAPTYNPAFPNGPNGGPAFPSSPPPDWTVAAQQERTRYEDEQRRNEHNKKLWGS